ncbi:TonB-dependent receptor, partial [bacterium]|nr:TonB-dependent receptor [bacterium]
IFSVIARQIVSETDLDDYSNSGWAGDQFNTNGVTPEPDGEKKHFQTTTFSITAVKLKNSFFQNFFQSSLILSSTERQRETLGASGTKLYEYIGKAEQASWLGTLSFETNEISFGLDQYTEKMESESSYETIQEVSAITTSFWIHDQLYLLDEALILSAGARNDTHEKSGSAATSRFAASYQLDAIKFKASYGTGFRTPSLYELFSQYGNTELKAETSTSWDIGFQHQVASVLYGITYFNISFEDRIDWVSISTDPWGQYQQAEGKTLSNGTETFIAVNPTRRLSLRLDHTKNHTEDPEGNRLKRRPTDKMGLKCNYQLGNSTLLKGSIQWVGDRSANSTAKNEDGTPVSTLNPYTVVNFSVAYDFTKSIKLYMKVDNLTDEFYETAWSYATPGRSFYAGIKAAF